LLQHVIAGNLTAVVMLGGRSSEEVVAARTAFLGEDRIGDDPAAAFATSAAAQVAAFAEPGALEGTIHHHFMGDMPSRQLLSFRIGALTPHAWARARATGADGAIHAGLVEGVYAAMEPTAPTIGSTGQFGDGPSATLPDDVPLQTRLLDLSGRRP